MAKTETAQRELEELCVPLLAGPAASIADLTPKHRLFLRTVLGLGQLLPQRFLGLDASHPWMVFWPVNALALLGTPLNAEEIDRIGETLLACEHPDGGFGGGPGQPGHLAATYAAVMALAYTGPKFWGRVNRKTLLSWILSLKEPSGAIRVCAHGEADPRATYCALAATTLLGIESAELRSGVGAYVAQCQTYEGGFANVPLGEAHGGYAFCSVATLMLLYPFEPRRGIVEFCRVADFERWLVLRQDLRVPGFSGRTNKLVDACYAHWVGGCWPLIAQVAAQVAAQPTPRGAGATSPYELFMREGLQDYLVKCCQSDRGGLRDKPGVSPDAYHSNYALCGLSGAQHSYAVGESVFAWQSTRVLDAGDNNVPPINPVFGILPNAVANVYAWAREHTISDALGPAGQAPGVVGEVTSKATGKATGEIADGTAKRASFSALHPSLNASLDAVPSSKEYQGFALYVGATVVLVAYLAWALLPASWLHALRIDYYPSRWWAVAIPAFVLVLMLYIYTALAAYNTERLTFAPNAPETVADAGTQVHDVPLVEVNRRMYASTNAATVRHE